MKKTRGKAVGGQCAGQALGFVPRVGGGAEAPVEHNTEHTNSKTTAVATGAMQERRDGHTGTLAELHNMCTQAYEQGKHTGERAHSTTARCAQGGIGTTQTPSDRQENHVVTGTQGRALDHAHKTAHRVQEGGRARTCQLQAGPRQTRTQTSKQ